MALSPDTNSLVGNYPRRLPGLFLRPEPKTVCSSHFAERVLQIAMLYAGSDDQRARRDSTLEVCRRRRMLFSFRVVFSKAQVSSWSIRVDWSKGPTSATPGPNQKNAGAQRKHTQAEHDNGPWCGRKNKYPTNERDNTGQWV